MKDNVRTAPVINWLCGLPVFAIGVMNLLWVHPVPGLVGLLLSLVYFPPANALLKAKTGLSIPPVVKIILCVVVIWFTLGVSDLGDLMD